MSKLKGKIKKLRINIKAPKIRKRALTVEEELFNYVLIDLEGVCDFQFAREFVEFLERYRKFDAKSKKDVNKQLGIK
jgi:hypothetical protein